MRSGRLAVLALLSCAVFAAGCLAGRLGPRAAVLLMPCPGPGANGDGLPAGSEIWTLPKQGGEGWKIYGQNGLQCPERVIGWVRR